MMMMNRSVVVVALAALVVAAVLMGPAEAGVGQGHAANNNNNNNNNNKQTGNKQPDFEAAEKHLDPNNGNKANKKAKSCGGYECPKCGMEDGKPLFCRPEKRCDPENRRPAQGNERKCAKPGHVCCALPTCGETGVCVRRRLVRKALKALNPLAGKGKHKVCAAVRGKVIENAKWGCQGANAHCCEVPDLVLDDSADVNKRATMLSALERYNRALAFAKAFQEAGAKTAGAKAAGSQSGAPSSPPPPSGSQSSGQTDVTANAYSHTMPAWVRHNLALGKQLNVEHGWTPNDSDRDTDETKEYSGDVTQPEEASGEGEEESEYSAVPKPCEDPKRKCMKKNMTGTYTDTEAWACLKDVVLKRVSSGNCWRQNYGKCTSLDNVHKQTVAGLIAFLLNSGCPRSDLVITGGTEVGHSTSGSYTHYKGYKFDLRPAQCLLDYIKNNFAKYKTYSTRWVLGNNIYYDEARGTGNHHIDIQFKPGQEDTEFGDLKPYCGEEPQQEDEESGSASSSSSQSGSVSSQQGDSATQGDVSSSSASGAANNAAANPTAERALPNGDQQ